MFTADATRELCKSLTVKELRTQCRSRNINPGGNVEALRQRLEDSMRETGDSSIVQDLPAAEQEEDQGFSKNNYARPGGVQNVGNRITDRPSSRVLAPPGGVSQVVFGGGQDAPAPYVSKRGGPGALPTTVDKSLYGGDAKEPSDQARAPPAGGFKGLSQVSFGEYQLPSYTTQNPTAAAHTKSSAERVHDDLVLDVDKMMKSLMVKDLRNNCRARNLSPAGGAEQLRQRLGEHMVATGDVQLVVEGDSDLPSGAGPQPAPPAIAYGAQSGMSEPTASNNYVRPAGQNVGNFLTGRPSSRVLAPPGGVSTIMLG